MTESETRRERILEDRDTGMTYREIAAKHGVSYQYVNQVCGKYNPERFRFIKKESCIYPNWRKWMNDEKCSRAELLRRMNLVAVSENCVRLGAYMKGEISPRKYVIDKLLSITGMTYEKMFAMEDDDGK